MLTLQDESIVHDGITFDKTDIDKNLTLFLYPDDSDEAGRRLRVSLSSPLGPHNALLSCDGRSPETISCQDTVDVALSDKYISLICFNEADQFEAIDKKLKGR